jgi:hypothetical protein
MPLTTIRAQLKTLLESVTGIGRVYDYKRYSSDWGTYKQLFVKNSKVNEWEIQRNALVVEPRGSQATAGKVKDTVHNLVIRGFYAFTDDPSSEKPFDTLVDSITDLFIRNQDLNGTAEIINIPITGEISFGQLGDVLCHVVEIKLSVRERGFL